jgi:hypothetical protein
MKLTNEKYEEMGFIRLGPGKVQDRHGDILYPKKKRSPLKAIRQFCFECMGMDRRYEKPPHPYDDVSECTDPVCPVFDFRFGKNPFLRKELTEEQKEVARKNIELARNVRRDAERNKRESTVRG